MPKTKRVVTKKRKTKQQVSVNVTVNSNNRRKVLSQQKQSSPIYIPTSSQSATPTVVLSNQPQQYPSHSTDIASHLENVVRKLAAHQTLGNTVKEPEKKLIETATETTPLPVQIKKEEPVLTPVPIKQERLLEPQQVSDGIHKVDTFMTPIRYPKGVSFEIPKPSTSSTRFERLLGEVVTPKDESRLLEIERKRTPSPQPDPETPYFPSKKELREYIQEFPDVKGIQNFSEKQLKDLLKVNQKYGQEAMLVRIEQIKKERKGSK